MLLGLTNTSVCVASTGPTILPIEIFKNLKLLKRIILNNASSQFYKEKKKRGEENGQENFFSTLPKEPLAPIHPIIVPCDSLGIDLLKIDKTVVILEEYPIPNSNNSPPTSLLHKMQFFILLCNMTYKECSNNNKKSSFALVCYCGVNIEKRGGGVI